MNMEIEENMCNTHNNYQVNVHSQSAAVPTTLTQIEGSMRRLAELD